MKFSVFTFFQNELCAATQALSQQLRDYEIQVQEFTHYWMIKLKNTIQVVLHVVGSKDIFVALDLMPKCNYFCL